MPQVIISIFIGMGLFYILCDIFSVPTFKTTKAMAHITSKGEKKEKILEVWLADLASFIVQTTKSNTERVLDSFVIENATNIYDSIKNGDDFTSSINSSYFVYKFI